jgi:hypothetical protein
VNGKGLFTYGKSVFGYGFFKVSKKVIKVYYMNLTFENNSNITLKKALVCPDSYVNSRTGYAKVFFLLQLGLLTRTLAITFARTLAITHRSIRKISTLIHTPKISTLIRGYEA